MLRCMLLMMEDRRLLSVSASLLQALLIECWLESCEPMDDLDRIERHALC